MSDINKASFVLGMFCAFCECVLNEAKPSALSPAIPLKLALEVEREIKRISNEMQVKIYFEENKDIKDTDIRWWFIYKFDKELEHYKFLRNSNYNPMTNFNEFKQLLGYGSTYLLDDENFSPKIKKEIKAFDTIDKIIFK